MWKTKSADNLQISPPVGYFYSLNPLQMLQLVNPRAAMFQSLSLNEAFFTDHINTVEARVTLEKILPASPDWVSFTEDSRGNKEALGFKLKGRVFEITIGQVLVKDRKTSSLAIYPLDEFERLFYPYVDERPNNPDPKK